MSVRLLTVGTWNKQTPSCIQGDEMITVIIMLLIINLFLSLYNTNLNVDAKSFSSFSLS